MTEVQGLVGKITDKKEGQASLEKLGQIAKENGIAAQPFLIPAIGKVLEATGDKSKNVKDAAVAAAKAIVMAMSPYAVDLVLPALLESLSVKSKPPQKEAALNLITTLATKCPRAVGYSLVTLVSPVAELTCDIKKR
jgi:hypothetical protein